MANIAASLKSIRQTAKRTARNRSIRTRVKNQLKKVRGLAASGSEEVRVAAAEYISVLDKAAKVGVVHHNKVARHKSMMSKYLF